MGYSPVRVKHMRSVRILPSRLAWLIIASFILGRASVARGNAESIRVVCLPVYELVTALDWSPDGTLLAVAAGNQVRVYQTDMDPDPLECSWNEHQLARLETRALTPALQFSPDGIWLATGSRDGRLRLWRVGSLESGDTQSAELIWDAHRKGVNALSWSPDGARLASGGNDALARIWDASTGQQLLQVIGGTFSVTAVAWSPGGDQLAVANGGLVRVRDTQAGRMLSTLRLEQIPRKASQPGQSIPSANSPPVAFSLSAKPVDPGWQLAIGDTTNGLGEWELSADGRQATIANTFDGHAGEIGRYSALVWTVVYSPDGQLLASAGGDGIVRLWLPEDGTNAGELPGSSLAMTSLAFHPSGEWLAAGSLDAGVYLYRLY